jgi:hypothetical protein
MVYFGPNAWVCPGQLDEAQPNTALHPSALRIAPMLIRAEHERRRG